MGASGDSVTLTAEQVEQINRQLADLRHNVNNYLSLMVAAVELMRRKPEMTARFVDSLADPPQKITAEVRAFSDQLQKALHITR
jgi:hypothetical protein